MYPGLRYSPSSRSTLLGARSRSISGPEDRSRSRDVDAPASRSALRSASTAGLADLRPFRLDRFERRDALAGDRFELFLQRCPVVGHEFGAVAIAGDFHTTMGRARARDRAFGVASGA